jgi:hypothetical protein
MKKLIICSRVAKARPTKKPVQRPILTESEEEMIPYIPLIQLE